MQVYLLANTETLSVFWARQSSPNRLKLSPMPRSRLAQIIRYPLAIALSLWIAGVGCMMGCEGMSANGATRSVSLASHASDLATIVSGDTCASSKSHDCCAHRRSGKRAVQIQTAAPNPTFEDVSQSSNGMQECPLAANHGAVVSPSRRNAVDAGIVTATPGVAMQDLSEATIPVSSKLRLPNRGHTYLRCCAFLI